MKKFTFLAAAMTAMIALSTASFAQSAGSSMGGASGGSSMGGAAGGNSIGSGSMGNANNGSAGSGSIGSTTTPTGSLNATTGNTLNSGSLGGSVSGSGSAGVTAPMNSTLPPASTNMMGSAGSSSSLGLSNLDTDNDGSIDSNEFRRDGRTNAQFNQLDTNGNGILSDSEIRAGVSATTQP